MKKIKKNNNLEVQILSLKDFIQRIKIMVIKKSNNFIKQNPNIFLQFHEVMS